MHIMRQRNGGNDPETVVMAKIDGRETVVMPKVGDSETVVMAKVGDSETAVMAKVGDSETAVMAKVGDSETAVMAKISDTVVFPAVTPEGLGRPHGSMPTPFDPNRHRPGDRETVFLPRFADSDNPDQPPGGTGAGSDLAGHSDLGLPLPDAQGDERPRKHLNGAWRLTLVRYVWLGQLLLAAAAALYRQSMVAVVLLTIVLLPVGLAVARFRGRHGRVRFRYAQRRRAARAPGALGPLSHLHRRFKLTEIPGTAGRRLGVVSDRTGWAVIVEVTPPSTASDGTWLTRVVEAAEPTVAGATAQVLVQQCGPAPHGPSGSQRRAWIVMRITAAEAGAPVNIGCSGVAVLLRTCVRRLSLALAEARLVATPLDADEVRTALESTMETRTVGPRSALVESWEATSYAGRTHVSFELRAWSVPQVAQLLRRAASAAGTTTTVSLPVAVGKNPDTGPALLRISHPDRRGVESTAGALRSAGIRLNRINGRHLRAIVATIPLGRVRL